MKRGPPADISTGHLQEGHPLLNLMKLRFFDLPLISFFG
jgi:hypothetical protein